MSPGGSGATPAGIRVDTLEALLPQTQCTRCGYPSCRAYASALAAGRADLNRCPPGGPSTVAALARALGRRPKPLDPACGEARPWVVARIDEAACIGCALCIRACPVDAILGAGKRMHTVIESECTGCELCLEPCPVDCITLAPMPWEGGGAADGESFLADWVRCRAPLARRRYRAREQRLERLGKERRLRRQRRAGMPGRDADRTTKRAVIEAAIERSRLRRIGRE